MGKVTTVMRKIPKTDIWKKIKEIKIKKDNES